MVFLQDEFGQALEEDPEEPSLLARILPACVREVLKCRDEDVAAILEANLATRDTGQAEETCEILESVEVKEILTRDDQAEVEDALKHKQFTQEEQASLKRCIRRLRGGGSSGSASSAMASHSDSGRLFLGNVELDPDQDSQVEVARDGVLTRAGMSDPKLSELYGKDFQAMHLEGGC
eukprot:s3934_g5.t1